MDFGRIKRYLYAAGFGLSGLLICTPALADNCEDLSENKTWTTGMTSLSDQMTKEKWDEALKTADSLYAICERSPILNYAMGRIHKEKGDEAKALYYMQRATLYTEEFAVKGKTLEHMWFDRYKAEHPEARPENIASRQQELERRQQELEERQKEIEALKLENTRLKGAVDNASLSGRLDSFEDKEAERRHYAAGLWTGVAAAGVGLILTGIGTGLIITNDDKTVGFKEESSNDGNKIKPYTKASNNVYWAMLGAGIGITVIGTIFTGIFGYYYNNNKQNNTVSFYNTPDGVGIQF